MPKIAKNFHFAHANFMSKFTVALALRDLTVTVQVWKLWLPAFSYHDVVQESPRSMTTVFLTWNCFLLTLFLVSFISISHPEFEATKISRFVVNSLQNYKFEKHHMDCWGNSRCYHSNSWDSVWNFQDADRHPHFLLRAWPRMPTPHCSETYCYRTCTLLGL